MDGVGGPAHPGLFVSWQFDLLDTGRYWPAWETGNVLSTLWGVVVAVVFRAIIASPSNQIRCFLTSTRSWAAPREVSDYIVVCAYTHGETWRLGCSRWEVACSDDFGPFWWAVTFADTAARATAGGLTCQCMMMAVTVGSRLARPSTRALFLDRRGRSARRRRR